ncbi:hypothetical protein WN51_08648 [Melipona quadrifasciata]|uniref:Uncharacterized protein n=1 Tax=Melipona quadrifasciata TaxID=166423 RepID=A0A0M9A9Z9_9HYME|nr:hypothetical protein WN51_08648 [Melipona quadrifasciata]
MVATRKRHKNNTAVSRYGQAVTHPRPPRVLLQPHWMDPTSEVRSSIDKPWGFLVATKMFPRPASPTSRCEMDQIDWLEEIFVAKSVKAKMKEFDVFKCSNIRFCRLISGSERSKEDQRLSKVRMKND